MPCLDAKRSVLHTWPMRAVERAGVLFGRTEDDDGIRVAYNALRIVVGLIGLSIAPIVVFVEELIGDGADRCSVSAYYHGAGGAWFTGALVTIGVFFIAYEFKPRPNYEVDNILSMIGGFSAVIVGLVPVDDTVCNQPQKDSIAGMLHTTAATIMFVILTIFCLLLFTKSRDEVTSTGFARLFRSEWKADARTPRKRRNVVYRVCGWVMVVALVVAVLSDSETDRIFFWAEVVATTAFSIAWLVKGGFVRALNDAPETIDVRDGVVSPAGAPAAG